MKSPCIEIEMLAGYIGKSLSNKEREQMERHLAECDDCRDDFVTANILLNDKDLSEWEPLSKAGHEVKALKDKIAEQAEKFYEWITAPLAELTLQPGFAGVRSQNESSATYIRLTPKIDDLKMEICIEKVSTDKVCIYVKMLKERERAKNIRLKFIREGGGRVSRLLKKESEPFDNLSFGYYRMILVQNSQTKGEFSFEINETGVREGKDLVS